jgi:hypothetical protein
LIYNRDSFEYFFLGGTIYYHRTAPYIIKDATTNRLELPVAYLNRENRFGEPGAVPGYATKIYRRYNIC